MAAYEKYYEVTEYILSMLTARYQQEIPLQDRRLTISFIEPLPRVFKGICNAKAQMVKKPEYRKWVNFRIFCDQDHQANEITFRLVPYVKDVNRMEV